MRCKVSVFLMAGLVITLCPLAILTQTEEAHQLDKFVGEWTCSLSVNQPGVKMFAFDKVKIELTDSNTISSEFKNNDINFMLEYSPSQKNYMLTYSFKQFGATRPLLSVDKMKLVYSEEEGYTGKETNEEKNWSIEVVIKIGEGEFNCDILSTAGGKTFEHKLNCFK